MYEVRLIYPARSGVRDLRSGFAWNERYRAGQCNHQVVGSNPTAGSNFLVGGRVSRGAGAIGAPRFHGMRGEDSGEEAIGEDEEGEGASVPELWIWAGALALTKLVMVSAPSAVIAMIPRDLMVFSLVVLMVQFWFCWSSDFGRGERAKELSEERLECRAASQKFYKI